MADANTQSKIDKAAEKAYEEAAAKTGAPKTAAPEAAASKPAAKTAAKPAPAAKVAAEKKAPAKKASAKKPTTKKGPAQKAPVKKTPVAAKTEAKPAAKKAPVKKAPPKALPKKAAAKKAPAKKPAVKKAPAKTAAPKPESTNPATKLKDTIMAKAEKTDFVATAKDVAADVQARVKTAAAKTGEIASDVNDFNKANMEAVVESGKIFFAGAQDLVRENVETGKTVVETVTEDAKKVAGVKSPTELIQLQGELARRNFDAVVSFGSQRTEAWVKLYNEAFAPITNRVSVAAEKVSKAA